LQANDGLDWDRAFARGEELSAGRMLRLALYVAHVMLDAPLPEEWKEKIETDSVTTKLGQGIRARFSLKADASLGVFERLQFRIKSRDSLRQGVSYAFRLATSPANPDRADLPLPGWFSGARALLRPLLLARRYGLRRSKTDHGQ